MARGILIGQDNLVATWAFDKFQLLPTKIDRGFGILDKDCTLCGAILFQYYNGVNVNLSYYGPYTLSSGIVRSIARVVISEFDAVRCTVVTSKKNKRFMRALQKFGFRLEGSQRRYYGHKDCDRNVGVRFVMFREQIDKIARIVPPQLEQNKV